MISCQKFAVKPYTAVAYVVTAKPLWTVDTVDTSFSTTLPTPNRPRPNPHLSPGFPTLSGKMPPATLVCPFAPRPLSDYYISFPPNLWFGYMRHVLSALVQNVPGVLAHISGMLASRGYNIDSLAVGATENPELSRMTFVVVGDAKVLEQVRQQLSKIVTVVRVDDVSSQDYVERDLMLLKVTAPPGTQRSEVRELVDIFRGRIVDVGAEELMIEISGRESKIEAFIVRMRPYGILELVRTGRIAMVRGRGKNHEETGA
jgi:acetolactate synthase-1/3 small subunit